MADTARVLVVAHQTAATEPLLEAVRERAQQGSVKFHLVVPKQPHGIEKLANPHEAKHEEAQAVLEDALPKLTEAAGSQVTGSVGDHEPLMAIEDTLNLSGPFNEIIISTLPTHVSRWLHLDLVSKTRNLGLPVTHVLPPH